MHNDKLVGKLPNIFEVLWKLVNVLLETYQTRSQLDNWGGGPYSYIRVLHYSFLLKSIVFTVCEHEYMQRGSCAFSLLLLGKLFGTFTIFVVGIPGFSDNIFFKII